LTVIGVAEPLGGTDLADRIGRLCVELGRGELAGIIGQAGAQPLLERLVRMLTAETADPAEVAAALDALDEAAARAGIDGLTTGSRAYRPVTWPVGAPQYGWVCPQRRCGRAETEPSDGDDYVCAITGAPLTRIRLTE
jgi:hypothetical protein